MNILFVDHACHRLTQSAAFFLDILREVGEVRTFYYDQCYRCRLPDGLVAWADTVVFWEFLPSRFACGVPGKRCVFVPMYDNEWGSRWQWRRLAHLGMGVVSFCDRLTRHARVCGVRDVLAVRFAYDPARFAGCAGDPRTVIVWERGGADFATVKALFAPEDVDRVIVMRRREESVRQSVIPPEDAAAYCVEIRESGFLPREDYLKLLAEPGVFVAPRLKEGIGMSFLEALAMGKCVIGHCDATMDEYLEDGVSGIVTDFRQPRRVTQREVAAVRKGVCVRAAELAARWQEDRGRIRAFFEQAGVKPCLAGPWSFRSLLFYALYWCEGAAMRLKGALAAKGTCG